MCVSVEFLNGPRVLMLRVYAQWKAAERRATVNNVKAHGCYRPGIPILIDCTEIAPDGLPDVRKLRAALSSSLRASRIAIVVTHGMEPSDEAFTLDRVVFASRADALQWLTAPDD